MKTWIVCSGNGAEYRGAFDSFDEAARFVAETIVRPRGYRELVFNAGMDATGKIDHFSWSAPTRPMTDNEIRVAAEACSTSAADVARTLRAWAKSRPVTDDWERIADSHEFIGERVSSVSISTVGFEAAYLSRASLANDNRKRQAEFAALIG